MPCFHRYSVLATAVKPSHPGRRLVSTASLPSPPPPKGYARLPTRRLISLRGRDAPHFLQGLTTQNIPSAISSTSQLSVHGLYSAFLNASGRVLHDVFIYSDRRPEAQGAPAFLIEVDAQEVHALARHLKRYRLRAKVTVDIVGDEEAQVWSVWNDTNSSEGVDRITSTWAFCEDTRAKGMGSRLVLAGDARPDIDAEMVETGTYEIRRILNGVAEGQGEILKESALPLESNIDYMGGIDFRKGCYVGQELTIRTHHTGVVRKRILPVRLYDSETAPSTLEYSRESKLSSPPRNQNIRRSNGKGRSTGKWLGGVGNVGLALCRLENMTDLMITGEGNQYVPDDEFILSWPSEEDGGGEVKIKAFVPDWHKNRINVRDRPREGNTQS